METRNRYLGSLLGLAAGDALGVSLEFRPPGTFEPVTSIVGGGAFDLPPGYWTDDTSMALCLAASLLERGWDPADQLSRYVSWYRDGYMSSTGRCFDIGTTCRAAIERFENTDQECCGSTDPRTAGNGSIMRLAPVPLYYAADLSQAISRAADSSRTTHAAAEALDACRYLSALIVWAVRGVPRETLLGDTFDPLSGGYDRPLCPRIASIAGGSFRRKSPPDIRGTGYVAESLEAALWALWHGTSFRTGALLAVNLGDDADTTGAVYGQLAGAIWGVSGIPDDWRMVVAHRELIETTADRLYEAARTRG